MAFEEIERKFLVKDETYKDEIYKTYKISQGYLNSDPKRNVRIRLRDKKGFITIKGTSSIDGLKRFEWEKELTYKEAKALMALCEPSVVEKKRHLIKSGEHIFEVDEFLGDNEGLIIAEVELKDKDENFEKPKWLGNEVSGDPKYYNSQLSKQPYREWQ